MGGWAHTLQCSYLAREVPTNSIFQLRFCCEGPIRVYFVFSFSFFNLIFRSTLERGREMFSLVWWMRKPKQDMSPVQAALSGKRRPQKQSRVSFTASCLCAHPAPGASPPVSPAVSTSLWPFCDLISKQRLKWPFKIHI